MKILALCFVIACGTFTFVKHANNESQTRNAEILWQFETGGCISVSPSVAGDIVFVGACNGLFFGINRHSGAVEWQYDIRKDGDQTGFHGQRLLTDDLVIVATDGESEGFIYAFEQASGVVRWKHHIGRPVPSDVIRCGKLIYVLTRDDSLFALELATGNIRWRCTT